MGFFCVNTRCCMAVPVLLAAITASSPGADEEADSVEAGSVTVDVLQTDLHVFVSGAGVYYRLPSILVTDRGTVLAACQKRWGTRSDWAESALVLKRSTDGGRSWGPEQTLYERPGYSVFNGTLVQERETGTGEVYVSYGNTDRRADPRCRLYSRSRDGGASFYQEGAAEDLPTHGCNAGLVSFEAENGNGHVLVMTYPLEPDRTRLACYVSRDDGRSGKRAKPFSQDGGYSDVGVLPNGAVIVLYEQSRATGLRSARFRLMRR